MLNNAIRKEAWAGKTSGAIGFALSFLPDGRQVWLLFPVCDRQID
ncbi:MAG: hypothetical protein U0T77_02990 [Chitinophagales bacterium]